MDFLFLILITIFQIRSSHTPESRQGSKLKIYDNTPEAEFSLFDLLETTKVIKEVILTSLLTNPAHPAGYPSGSDCYPDGYKMIKAADSDNTFQTKAYAYLESEISGEGTSSSGSSEPSGLPG